MSKLTEKFSNFFNSIGFWFTGGSSEKAPTGRLVLLGLSIVVPIVLIMLAPWIGWMSISPEHRYDVQYNWLQDFMWIWPVSLFGIIFLSVIGSLIYNGVKQNKVNKENEKFQLPK